jgi:hypothetical protein
LYLLAGQQLSQGDRGRTVDGAVAAAADHAVAVVERAWGTAAKLWRRLVPARMSRVPESRHVL